jgi:hypothetical protein
MSVRKGDREALAKLTKNSLIPRLRAEIGPDYQSRPLFVEEPTEILVVTVYAYYF